MAFRAVSSPKWARTVPSKAAFWLFGAGVAVGSCVGVAVGGIVGVAAAAGCLVTLISAVGGTSSSGATHEAENIRARRRAVNARAVLILRLSSGMGWCIGGKRILRRRCSKTREARGPKSERLIGGSFPCECVNDAGFFGMAGEVDIALFVLSYATDWHTGLCQQRAPPRSLVIGRFSTV